MCGVFMCVCLLVDSLESEMKYVSFDTPSCGGVCWLNQMISGMEMVRKRWRQWRMRRGEYTHSGRAGVDNSPQRHKCSKQHGEGEFAKGIEDSTVKMDDIVEKKGLKSAEIEM